MEICRSALKISKAVPDTAKATPNEATSTDNEAFPVMLASSIKGQLDGSLTLGKLQGEI